MSRACRPDLRKSEPAEGRYQEFCECVGSRWCWHEPTFIYALAGPDGIYYVGRTKKPMQRRWQHSVLSGPPAVNAKAREIRAAGGAPRFVLLDVVPANWRRTPHQAETRWIRYAQRRGCRLVNVGQIAPAVRAHRSCSVAHAQPTAGAL